MRYIKYTILSLLLLSNLSCSDSRIFDDVQGMESDEWKSFDIIKFNVSVSDTATAYDILVHIRNTNKYEYSNLWMFVETSSPNGAVIRDTVEFFLADKSGEWLGDGISSVNSLLVPYKSNIRFPYRGVYTFKFQQAMRNDILHGIKDIGLRIQERK